MTQDYSASTRKLVKLIATKQNKYHLLERVSAVLDEMTDCDDCEIIIQPFKSKRSIEQNQMLWKLYQILIDKRTDLDKSL